MELLTKIGWSSLALIHVMPALVLFRPSITEALYGITSSSDAGLLIVHRGALFLAIVVGSIWALFDPATRRVISVLTAISVVGFLILYLRAEMPPGPLRFIAWVDLAALAPLGVVLV